MLDGEGGPQAVFTGVDEGSRADEAGLERGDVVFGFDGEMLDDPDRAGRHFNEIEPGTEVGLAVRRGGDELDIRVARAKTGYMGVGPGPLDEDPAQGQWPARRRPGVSAAAVSWPEARRTGPACAKATLSSPSRAAPSVMSNLREHLMQIGAGETVEITLIRNDDRLILPVTLTERPRPD